MPVPYSAGVMKEHLPHTRSPRRPVDVSHMVQIALHCEILATSKTPPER